MTPNERALLIAMARIVADGDGRLHLLEVLDALRKEDLVAAQASPPTAVMPRWAEEAETAQPVQTIELHRCSICGTRWLLWPAAIHGGGWNLLDKWQRPGSCCDNAAMGDQIEHLRDFELVASPPTPEHSNAFHAHLDVCKGCRDHPFDLCPKGARLLRETCSGKPASSFSDTGEDNIQP